MKSLFYILLICSLILIGLWYYKRKPTEGFQQQDRFILKTDQNIYDKFYSEIYDELWKPEDRVKYELDLIIKTIQPDKRFSRMLDVGCGTGSLLKELKKKGFQAKGIELSKAMSQRNNISDITHGDILEPMVFDRSDFTHIFCLDFTIYELEDKTQFFKNCYYWLQNNGYLVLHVVDPKKFNAIVPAARPPVLESIEQLGPTRITKTEIDFIDFIYSSDYIEAGENIIHKESFTDKQTHNIRQNETTLYIDDIWDKARNAGFIVKGAFSLIDGPSRDAAQQIVILERTS